MFCCPYSEAHPPQSVQKLLYKTILFLVVLQRAPVLNLHLYLIYIPPRSSTSPGLNTRFKVFYCPCYNLPPRDWVNLWLKSLCWVECPSLFTLSVSLILYNILYLYIIYPGYIIYINFLLLKVPLTSRGLPIRFCLIVGRVLCSFLMVAWCNLLIHFSF